MLPLEERDDEVKQRAAEDDPPLTLRVRHRSVLHRREKFMGTWPKERPPVGGCAA
jgi:hypothetical protein